MLKVYMNILIAIIIVTIFIVCLNYTNTKAQLIFDKLKNLSTPDSTTFTSTAKVSISNLSLSNFNISSEIRQDITPIDKTETNIEVAQTPLQRIFK